MYSGQNRTIHVVNVSPLISYVTKVYENIKRKIQNTCLSSKAIEHPCVPETREM